MAKKKVPPGRPLVDVPIIGREDERQMFSERIKSGTLPRTILLTGAPGIGKRRMAFWLAEALVCKSGDACGTCPDCRRARSLTHPDVLAYFPHASIPAGGGRENAREAAEEARHEAARTVAECALYPESPPGHGYGVATARAIVHNAARRPYQDGGRRVFIVSDADRMGSAREAQNMLLKVLEEPPASTWFILTASAASVLLDTVQSRLTEFTLAPLSPSEIERILADNAPVEGLGQIAKDARGSLRRALQMCTPEWKQERERIASWLAEGLVSFGARAQAAAAEGHSGARANLKDRLEHILHLLYAAARETSSSTSPGIATVRGAVRADATLADWSAALHAAQRAALVVERNANPQLLVFTLLTELAAALGPGPVTMPPSYPVAPSRRR